MTDLGISQEQIRQLWNKYMSGGKVDGSGLRKIIFDSWERSRNNQVSFQPMKAPIIFQGESLDQHKNLLRDFIAICLPVMQNLYEFASDKGDLIFLSDNQGCLLEVIGSGKVKEIGCWANCIPGALWSEEAVGTNSVGTTLVVDQPIQVRGCEHYCRMLHPWFCSAAPIHDPAGMIIGTLNIASPSERIYPHTLGMVVTAVSAIETQIKLQQALRSQESATNYKNAVMESISEGIVAIDSSANITHMNGIIARVLKVNQHQTGQNLLDLVSPEDLEVRNIVLNKRIVTDYEINVRTDNRTRAYLLTTRPLYADGANEGMVLVATAIKRAERLAQRMGGSDVRLTFADIVGKNRKFLETVDLARKAAGSISTVLLLGESGTGKEVFSQSIHNASSRHRGPFVAINCAAIPRELIASELFGYTDGAFTGARRGGKIGKFELAQGGTMLLDEIAEMPLDLQATLLRVLETKTITRIGGNEVTPVDVRIIAATNRDPNEAVQSGKFRQDLFYRLNVFTINIPPLRERKDDLPLLVSHFIGSLCTKLKKQPISEVDEAVWEVFNSYDWPGNVRELQNVLERVVNVCNERVLTIDHLPPEILTKRRSAPLEIPVKEYEKSLIVSLLKRHNGNITRVANEMGIARTTLYKKIAKYHLHQ